MEKIFHSIINIQDISRLTNTLFLQIYKRQIAHLSPIVWRSHISFGTKRSSMFTDEA